MDTRIAEPIWDTDKSGMEASLVERLEAQVEELTRKVGRMERRQQRFTDMIRLLLELHDRTAVRLHALDGREAHESVEELTQVARELTQSAPGTSPLPRRS